MPASWIKDINATLDYSVDWGDWLDAGDTIASTEWIVPDGLTSDAESLTGAVATIRLAGGTVGQRYAITCRATSAAGLVDDRTIRIRIAQL